jgi:lipopolysaccharide biosynthesis glycosyltransferase
MMLINIPIWNSQKISECCFDYLSKYPERIKFVDQCALNAVLKDNWLKLPYTYNCLTSYIPRDLNPSKKNAFLKDIVILHFTLERPWIYLNKHPFRKLYYQYLKPYSVSKYKFIGDFEISKIPQRLKLNFIEWYLGNAMMRVCWNKIKNLFKIPA